MDSIVHSTEDTDIWGIIGDSYNISCTGQNTVTYPYSYCAVSVLINRVLMWASGTTRAKVTGGWI